VIQAKVLGQNSLRTQLAKCVKAQRVALQEAVAESLEDVQTEARRNLPRGSDPELSTGVLARSIEVRLDADGLGGSVGTDLPYGRYLEFGTQQMTARPWLQPAFDSLKSRIHRRFAAAVKAANREATRSTPGHGGGSDAGVGF
jgi:HK97 gp10 family phage protein